MPTEFFDLVVSVLGLDEVIEFIEARDREVRRLQDQLYIHMRANEARAEHAEWWEQHVTDLWARLGLQRPEDAA